jgi:hypothetical protein
VLSQSITDTEANPGNLAIAGVFIETKRSGAPLKPNLIDDATQKYLKA